MSFDQGKRRRVYALRFDEDYPGLVIQCRKPGYLPFRQVAQAVLVLGDDLSGRGMPGDALLVAWAPLLEAFQASIVRWNLLDDGRSVPVDQFLNQDWEFLVHITKAWYERVALRPEQEPRPQPVDGGVGNPPEDYPVPSPLPPTIGEDGTDEEWLAQFASVPPPAGVDPATNEPPVHVENPPDFSSSADEADAVLEERERESREPAPEVMGQE